MNIKIPQIWALWPSVLDMSRATGWPRWRLYRERAAGALPPAALDLVIIAQAGAVGVPLRLSDLALARWHAAGKPGADLVERLAAARADP
jgi:hypothetical protein